MTATHLASFAHLHVMQSIIDGLGRPAAWARVTLQPDDGLGWKTDCVGQSEPCGQVCNVLVGRDRRPPSGDVDGLCQVRAPCKGEMPQRGSETGSLLRVLFQVLGNILRCWGMHR